MLFHVSEDANIERFQPRLVETYPHPAVWAIDREHLRNYLLPRDCPRVTYYRIPSSSEEDVAKYLGGSSAVVAIEGEWLPRLRSCTLYCYAMPSSTFECIDEGAGYFVSRQPVRPDSVETIQDPVSALTATGATLRTVDNLWPLHDAVAKSTLQFSMIRMRNAKARGAPQTHYFEVESRVFCARNVESRALTARCHVENSFINRNPSRPLKS